MRIAVLTPLLAVAALALLPAGAAAQNPWLERRVLNIAHQGGESEFPSNTLYAFRALGPRRRRHARARRRRHA